MSQIANGNRPRREGERGPALLAIGAGVAIVLLLVNAGLTYRNTLRLSQDAAWVAHTEEVLGSFGALFSLVQDAETGQRGFLITDEPRYLEPYTAAIAKLAAEVERIETLTRNDPQQQQRLPILRERIDRRLQILERNIALQRTEGREALQRSVLTDESKNAMDSVRVVISEMIQHERDLLIDRQRRSASTLRTVIITDFLSWSSALVALIALAVSTRRHLLAQKRASQIIAEQGERYRTTLASIGDAVIATDGDGQITDMNPVAETLTGWTNAEAAGRPLAAVFRIVHESTRESVPSPAIRALSEGVIVGLANHTILIGKDGSERPIDDSAAPIRCKEGEIVGCVLVFRDVTERRRVERELEKLTTDLVDANRRKDEFLATLAHELRNPLAPIRNGLALIKVAKTDLGTVEEARALVERQLAHLVRLVDDLLDMSRITTGKLELRREPVELAPIIQQTLETCRPVIEESGQRLMVTLPKQPVHLRGDAVRLVQVFSNLINNACKYGRPDGEVSIVATVQDSEVVVSVKDTGVGIPAETLPLVFDMFRQIDAHEGRKAGGLGIGLTLVKRLVELHGGSVRAASDGKDKGSLFEVRLPLDATGAKPESKEKTSDGSRIVGRRVLVVDDNEDSAVSLSMLLRISGNQTEVAHDGLRAIEAAELFRPDLILLDIGLPKMDGYQVAQAIRQLPWGGSVVLVALTGWGQDEDRQRSKDAGFDLHMVKPVDHAALASLVAKVRPGRDEVTA